MKKTQTMIVALFAVLAVGAVMASSALAVSEWLVDGGPIASPLAALTSGLLTLINAKEAGSSTVLVAVDCEGTLDGFVGAGAKDEITKVLNAEGVEVPELTEGNFLNCTVSASEGGVLDCRTGELAEVWPSGLPWKTEIELMTAPEPEFLDKFLNGGYEVRCKTPLGTLSNTCTGASSASLKNVTGGVEGVFGPGVKSEATNCTLTGNGTGLLEGSGVTDLVNGKALTVS